MRRSLLGALALVALTACGSGAAAGRSGTASAAVSPCGAARLPAWSPDGKRIAFVGHRWPPSQHAHRVAGQGLRAICVANADGSGARPLPNTVCSERCAQDLIDSPTQLVWATPRLLLYGDDFRIFAIPIAGKPKELPESNSLEQFSVDRAGDRIAAGTSNCPRCSGPVTVIDVPSGTLVARIGGKKLDNV